MSAREPYDVVSRRTPPGPFAANLALLLRRRGMEARELANRLGLNPRHVRRLREGTVAPAVVEIPRLARALGVRPEWLAWLPTELLAARVTP